MTLIQKGLKNFSNGDVKDITLDLRGKTLTDIQNAGFDGVSWTWYALDSYWLHLWWTSNTRFSLYKYVPDLSSDNVVEINMKGSATRNYSWHNYQYNCYFCCWLFLDNVSTWSTSLRCWYNTGTNDHWYIWIEYNESLISTTSSTFVWWNYDLTARIDLSTWVVNYTLTSPTIFTTTATLTSSQLQNLLTYKYITIQNVVMDGSNSSYLTDVSVKITSPDEWYLVKKLWLWDNLIRPKPWQPNSHTLLYCPLKDDILDHTGNHTMSAVTTSYGTVAKDSTGFYHFTWWYISSENYTWPTQWTISVWVNRENKSTGDTTLQRWLTNTYKSSSPFYNMAFEFNNSWYTAVWTGSTTYFRNIWASTLWQWELRTMTYSSSEWWKMYKNGALVDSFSSNQNLWQYNWPSLIWWSYYQWSYGLNEQYFKWYLSDVIMEDTVWTAEQCKEYFLSTKGRYWYLNPIPKPVIVEEYYDFKQIWNATDFANAWWTYRNESNWIFAINSSMWVYSSRDWHISIFKDWLDLSNAKKFTMTATYYSYLDSWVWWWYFQTEDTAHTYAPIFHNMQFNNNSWYNQKTLWTWNRNFEQITYNLPTWEHLFTLEVDLETWAVTLTCDSLYTLTWTLSASEIEDMRTYSNMVNFHTCYNGWRQHQIWNVWWKIEN